MKKQLEITNKSIKISLPIAIAYALMLLGTSFYSGYAWNKLKSGTSQDSNVATSSTINFAAQKTQKAELKFFVMSFCPYGNQIEDVLRPVFDLLKDKADMTPHYIFNKVTDLANTCKAQSGDPSQCQSYVTSLAGNTNAPFKTVAECKKYITKNINDCQNESQYIKSADGSLYASLHGRQEANQDVREICAWNQSTDKTQWWNFIGAVNKNCTAQNADTCWEDQAKSAGLDTTKITECFNKEGIDLIEKEIAISNKYNVSSSPTVLINDVAFPPETAYTQDGKGSLKIGTKVATQDQYQTPNVIKTAICASFQKSPAECKTIIDDLSGSAPNAGGCN